MPTSELYFYNHFNYNQLVAMGNVYFSKNVTPFQKNRYEQVRAGLLAELRQLYPEAPDSGTACYIHAAIGAVLYKRQYDERHNLEGAAANAASARTQLKAWDWEGLK